MQRMEGELRATLPRAQGPDRPRPARRQSGPQRAGHRRDQLSLPVRALDAIGLRRLDRLRVQAEGGDRGGPRLVRALPRRARITPTLREITSMKIGFIGLGIMGAPMAGHLIKGGHELFLNTRRRRSGRSGRRPAARACASPAAEVAQQADVIITMVPDTPDVETVLFGDGRRRRGPVDRQDRRRHELDLADRHQGLRQAHQRARLRLPRRAGLGRRGRRQGGDR